MYVVKWWTERQKERKVEEMMSDSRLEYQNDVVFREVASTLTERNPAIPGVGGCEKGFAVRRRIHSRVERLPPVQHLPIRHQPDTQEKERVCICTLAKSTWI